MNNPNDREAGRDAARGTVPGIDASVYSALFEQSPDPLFILGEAGTILACNESAGELFGYGTGELDGTEFYSLLADNIADRLPELLKQENLTRSGSADVTFSDKSGARFRAMLLTKLVTTDNGLTLKLIRVHEADKNPDLDDVTQVESLGIADFLPAITNEPEMVVEMDLTGRMTYANHLCTEKTGFAPDDIQSGLTMFDLLAEDPSSLKRDLAGVLRGECIEGKEYVLKKKDGSTFPVIASISSIVSDGEVVGARAVALDITDHKNMERDLLILEKLRTMGELASGVMHDFNNVLAIILGYTYIHPKVCRNARCIGIMEKIKRTAMDGTEIIKRINNFSQINVRKKLELVDMNDVVKDVVDLLGPKWRNEAVRDGKSIDIDLRLNPVPSVLASAPEIREVMSNLFINAVDAIDGEGTITLSTEVEESGDEDVRSFVIVRVSDTGSGMSEIVQRRIFEPFFTTKNEKGTGMGMSVSYGIINKFGGDITVESREGEGTTVTVILPAAVDEESVEENDIPVQHSGGGSHVLVVDDEENICEILREFLESEGYSVETASHGEEGLELFRAHPASVVITDLNMPGMSGWDLARTIKKESADTVIVLLSGWSSGVEEFNRKEQLVEKIFPKPIDFSSLLDYIKSIDPTEG